MYKVFFNDTILYFTNEENPEQKVDIMLSFREIENLQEFTFDLVNAGGMGNILIRSFDLESDWMDFKACFKVIEAAGGIVKNREDKILFMKRRGLWDLPKGKREKGETIEHCAQREIEEECGIVGLHLEKKIIETYHTYMLKGRPVLKRTYWYLFKYEGNEAPVPQTEEDISEVIWVFNNEIEGLMNNTFKSIEDVVIAFGRL